MRDIESKIKKYLTDRGWEHISPADLAKSISIESAELLELFQWNNPSIDELKRNKEKFDNFKKELADVLIYCIDLAVISGLDTRKIIEDKLRYNIKKFPVSKVKGNAENYFEIKKKYRARKQ